MLVELLNSLVNKVVRTLVRVDLVLDLNELRTLVMGVEHFVLLVDLGSNKLGVRGVSFDSRESKGILFEEGWNLDFSSGSSSAQLTQR